MFSRLIGILWFVLRVFLGCSTCSWGVQAVLGVFSLLETTFIDGTDNDGRAGYSTFYCVFIGKSCSSLFVLLWSSINFPSFANFLGFYILIQKHVRVANLFFIITYVL